MIVTGTGILWWATLPRLRAVRLPSVIRLFRPQTNRITSAGWLYDAAGNTIRDGNYQTFTYDGENKQTEVKNSSGVSLGQYFYDGDGKRVKKVVPGSGETTVFAYDATGKSIAEYSTIIYPTNDAKVAYVTTDHLGSPRINTDQNGAVTARHDYHPFGEEIIALGNRTTTFNYAADTVRKQFTSYERDNEINLDFAEARYYNPMHGRFTSVDPENAGASADNPQTWNAYAYVGNNPINITDPDGLSWYFNSSIGEAGQYRWYEDNQTPADGFRLVNGINNHVYYAGEGVGYVALNPTANKFQTFDTQEAATKRVGDIYACPECQSLVNTVADESVKKGTTVAIGAGVAVAVGTGAGVVMAATGTAAGAGITTLGLTSAGTTATTAGAAASAAEVAAVTARGLANPSTRGLTQQLIKHQQKLLEYIKNPANADNKGFLRNASPEKFDKVFSGRVKELTHQINNFYQQIKSKLQ